jgi:Asp/Glu/hydantoin racemase
MRIWHQSMIVLEDVPAYAERVRQHVDRIRRPDTIVDLHGLKPSTYPTNYPGGDFGYSFLFGMHSLQCPANALAAAKAGYDAFALCTIIDPLYREIKTIVDIPVIAAGETCFHLAGMHGHRFGLMLFMDRVSPRYQQLIDWSGLSGRCAGIRQSGVTFQEVNAGFERPGPVIDKFREAARQMIAAGADVIIPGEIPMNVLLATEGVHRVDDVPVIDCLGVTVKMAETLVDLKALTGLSHSRHGWHNAAPPAARVAEVMNFYCQPHLFETDG